MSDQQRLRAIPSVNEILQAPAVAALTERHGRELVTYGVRAVLSEVRAELAADGPMPESETIAARVGVLTQRIAGRSLKPVLNATGIIIHTNLGRAPLGEPVLEEIRAIAGGYSNLEFDLDAASRGQRNSHVASVMRFLTGAEDAIVVNNNAAGIILALKTLADGREVIISRGELIEIGGSFRIPDIMAAGGVRMVEVGTTNRTRLKDYEQAITPETAILFKAHKSNYEISGFTEEASVAQLAGLAKTRGLPLVYDIGSGLLRKPARLRDVAEPDVRGALAEGADLVTFSCDKLLGGPQGGIVAGKAELVTQLARAPFMRAVRVGKLTLAALSAACRSYLSDATLLSDNPVFAMLERQPAELKAAAEKLAAALQAAGLTAEVVDSAGHCGGGTLPNLELKSFAVKVGPAGKPKRAVKVAFAERMFRALLERDTPVLAVLREGRILFDMLTVPKTQIAALAAAIRDSADRAPSAAVKVGSRKSEVGSRESSSGTSSGT